MRRQQAKTNGKKNRLEPGGLEITVREICRNNVSCPYGAMRSVSVSL
jgi:hypothetical protein